MYFERHDFWEAKHPIDPLGSLCSTHLALQTSLQKRSLQALHHWRPKLMKLGSYVLPLANVAGDAQKQALRCNDTMTHFSLHYQPDPLQIWSETSESKLQLNLYHSHQSCDISHCYQPTSRSAQDGYSTCSSYPDTGMSRLSASASLATGRCIQAYSPIYIQACSFFLWMGVLCPSIFSKFIFAQMLCPSTFVQARSTLYGMAFCVSYNNR